MVPSGRPIYNGDSVDLFYRSHINREVYHYRITALTEDTFEQHRFSDSTVFEGLKTNEWNRRFMHTVNPVYPWMSDEPRVAVDGLKADSYEWSIGIYTID